ncbi:MAG: hypothetical protein WDA06_00960 [Phenylobacterium sp.]
MSTQISTALQTKVAEAAKVIEGMPIFAQKLNVMPEDYIWSRLEKLQIGKDEISHEMLLSEYCREGDARVAFCENGEPNLAVPWFRKIWHILKGKVEVESNSTNDNSFVDAVAKIVESNKPISQWKDLELVKELKTDCPVEIVEELKNRSGNVKFVVFADETNGVIDVDLTVKLLQLSRRQPLRDFWKNDDKTYRLYHVDSWPNEVFLTCPFHPNVLLLSGYCDECEASFDKLGDEVVKFMRILYNRGDGPKDRISLDRILTIAKDGGIDGLKKLFTKAAFEYEDALRDGNLPNLTTRKATIKQYDPLNIHKVF